MSKIISVILPCYNSAPFIPILYEKLKLSISKLGFEYQIIFVNDNSPSNDWAVIKGLSLLDEKIIALNFSRNFGQHAALFAGLEHASGEYVVVMDADMQDNPDYIENLYNALKLKNSDVVFVKRTERKSSRLDAFTSFLFHKLLTYFTGVKSDPETANYCIMKYDVAQKVVNLKEYRKIIPIMIKWTGFDISYIALKHKQREFGRSNYTFKSRLKLAINIWTYYSNRPLNFIIKIGLLVSAISFTAGIYLIISNIIAPSQISGWASIVVLISFFGGCNIAFLGFLGIYMGNIFDEVKQRPPYIIKNAINIRKKNL